MNDLVVVAVILIAAFVVHIVLKTTGKIIWIALCIAIAYLGLSCFGII